MDKSLRWTFHHTSEYRQCCYVGETHGIVSNLWFWMRSRRLKIDIRRSSVHFGHTFVPYSEDLRISSWSYDMAGHAKKCVERYCELANKTTQQLYKVSTPCIDDHHFKEEEMKSVGELSHVCSQIVLKCLYLARIGRPDILWSVNKLARSITKWTKACDKRLNRLISYIHHTCEYKQYCHVGNTAKQCRLGLFQDSDFAGDLEDSKSTSGGTLCVFGSHTFVPISLVCEKQTSVSHSSTEAKICFLMQVYAWTEFRAWLVGFGDWNISFRTEQDWTTQGRVSVRPVACHQAKHAQPHPSQAHQCHSNKHWSHSIEHNTMHFEWGGDQNDCERSKCHTTIRHVSRTHKVALVWLFDRINFKPKSKSVTLIPNTNLQTSQRDFHAWWVKYISWFIEYLPFEVFSLHQKFQLALPHYDGKKNSETKKKENSCIHIGTCDECVFLSCCDKLLCRMKSDCIEKSGNVWSFGETDSGINVFSIGYNIWSPSISCFQSVGKRRIRCTRIR